MTKEEKRNNIKKAKEEIEMELFTKILKKTGWAAVILSLVSLGIGILLVANPESIIKMIAYTISAIFLIVGAGKIGRYLYYKGKFNFYDTDIIYGIIAILLGVIFIIYHDALGAIFRITIGIWIIYLALTKMNLSTKLKQNKVNAWLYHLILAFLMLMAGLYVSLVPGTLIVTVGIIIIVTSIIDIIENIIFLYHVKDFTE